MHATQQDTYFFTVKDRDTLIEQSGITLNSNIRYICDTNKMFLTIASFVLDYIAVQIITVTNTFVTKEIQ